MNIERIAEVLHKSVVKKLINDLEIPDTLQPFQDKAAFEKTFDILKQQTKNRDIKSNLRYIQRDATIMALREVPIAIKSATPPVVETDSSSHETKEDDSANEGPSIQDLVSKELEKRGIQDQELGAVPTPESAPRPEVAPEPTPQINTLPIQETTDYLEKNKNDSVSNFLDEMSNPPVHSENVPTPTPPPVPTPSHRLLTTIVSQPPKGVDGLRWSVDSSKSYVGVSRVYVSPKLVGESPFLLLNVQSDSGSVSHPLIPTNSSGWFKVPYGETCLSGINGNIKISITDPNNELITTRYPMWRAKEDYKEISKGLVDPESGIAVPFTHSQTLPLPSSPKEIEGEVSSDKEDAGDLETEEDQEETGREAKETGREAKETGREAKETGREAKESVPQITEGFLLLNDYSVVTFLTHRV